MKNRRAKPGILTSIAVVLTIIITGSCKKSETMKIPLITSTNVSTVTETSATSGGTISSNGGGSVTDRGVCWSITSNPDLTNNKTSDGRGNGSFTITITGLTPGTSYHLRAYATNSVGTGYGNDISFKTIAALATLTTTEISAKTSSSASSGGNISADGGANITVRGVCWSTTANPTISENKTSDGTGTGSFASILSGLKPGVTYHVRAYATNSKGTSYGNDVTFITNATIPVLTGTVNVTRISSTTASSGGLVSSDGGASITAHGVCWSISHNPSITNSKTSDPIAGLDFTSIITGLLPGNTYYVRAYATNSAGTAYGNEIEYILPPEAPTLTTASIQLVTSTSALAGGTVTSDGGSAVTNLGVCFNTSGNPTIADFNTNLGAGVTIFTDSLTNLTPNTTYYLRAYATNNVGTGYGNDISFTTLELSGTLTDIDGNIYQINSIGTQMWMKENLKTNKLNDGTLIPVVINGSWSTLTIPGLGWYNNDPGTYKDKYGGYYNWYTINTGKLCPLGWRVPNDADWATLFNFLGGLTVAGGKLKEAGLTNWKSPNTGATNESGFTGLPGGYRFPGDGSSFGGLSQIANWWTTSQADPNLGFHKQLQYDTPVVSQGGNVKNYGRNVRCVK